MDIRNSKEYYYFVDDMGYVSIDKIGSSKHRKRKEYGNCFENAKEAHKVAEKLDEIFKKG